MSIFTKLRRKRLVDMQCAPLEDKLMKLALDGCMEKPCSLCNSLYVLARDSFGKPIQFSCEWSDTIDKLNDICGCYWAETNRGQRFSKWEHKLFLKRHPETGHEINRRKHDE